MPFSCMDVCRVVLVIGSEFYNLLRGRVGNICSKGT